MTTDYIGQQFGTYRLVSELGKGGFAEVYRGEHLYLKNYAAVKVLLTSPDETQSQQFLAEAQILARLNHPHIIRIREFEITRGIPFIAMDYAPGGTLRQLYPKGSVLSLEQTVVYIKQIADALQFAHNQNIIHRDVKPANILLDAQRNPKLSDFGISLLSSQETQVMAGTLQYMAPEQLRGQASFASDQYSLAVMAYEWLCGVRPFENALAYQHTFVAPPRLREKDSSLPEAVEAVVLKALAKDPLDRYSGVLQFAQTLEVASQRGTSYAVTDGGGRTYDPILEVSKRIFLSAPSYEDPFAVRLKGDLEERNIQVSGFEVNGQNEEGVRQALRESQLLLLILPVHVPSLSLINEHLRIANIYRRPVVCIEMAGHEGQKIAQSQPVDRFTLVSVPGRTYRQVVDEIVDSFEREWKRPAHEEIVPPERTSDPRNPYKGLRAFAQEDAGDFFGRKKLVQEIINKLNTLLQPASPGIQGRRLLTIIGPGGSGKSSVALAGVLPRLRQSARSSNEKLPEQLSLSSENWLHLDPIVPEVHPLDALVSTLAPHFPNRTEPNIYEILQKEGAYGLHQLATELVANQKNRVFLFIDQFEELFSSSVSEQERQQFIDLIVTAVSELHGPMLILLTLRADFYDRPFAYPALGRLVQQQQCAILPMDLDALRDVIEGPATLPDVRLTFEKDLVHDMLFEIRDRAEALPLLEFTLDQLFQRRNGRYLTLRSYQEMGGVMGALSKHAEATYASFPSDEHRLLSRSLFVRLITPGMTEQHDPTRRRAPLTEFIFADPVQTQHMQETIEAFLITRLLIISKIAGNTILEVSHEALITEWTRLKEWMQEAQSDISLQHSLSTDAAEWERRDRPKDQLYPRSRIKEFRAWQTRNVMSKQEAAFLNASKKLQISKFIRNAAIVLFVLLLLIPTSAFAFPIIFISTVTNFNDNGSGSLREAIDNAQSGTIITFAPWLHGMMSLQAPLDIVKNITIRGPGPDKLSISFGDQSTSILIKRLYVFSGAKVNISGITFKNTKSISPVIINQGTLTLTKCSIANNTNYGSTVGTIENSQGNLSLVDSTISGNVLRADNATGGGIDNNRGTVLLLRSSITDNQVIGLKGVANGGGISSQSGEVILNQSRISNNSVIGKQLVGYTGGVKTQLMAEGGGIAMYAVGEKPSILIVNNTIISENTVTGPLENSTTSGNTSKLVQAFGGGIASYSSVTTISNSTISGNKSLAMQSLGGGIISQNGTLKVVNSTVSNNITTSKGSFGFGGGIFDENDTAFTITNSTISNNAVVGAGLNGGGGIDVNQSSGTISFCTIYGNTASFAAGIDSISSGKTSSQVVIKDSFVANTGTIKEGPDVYGLFTSGGYNLIQNFAGATFLDPFNKHATDIAGDKLTTLGIDSQLRNNGGPTQTYALLANSPAINQIPANICDETADQRGVKRPQGSACDIGAYEYVHS